MMRLLFSSRGRIGRKGYWLTGLALTVTDLVICGILAAVAAGTVETVDGHITQFGTPAIVATVVAVVIQALFFWAFLVVAIKRCHDHNRSGVFLFLNFVPLANTWLFVEQGFVPGTIGPNLYGPDPVIRWTPPLVSAA